MKLKTKLLRKSQNFPLYDAVKQKTSIVGWSLLQWDFNSKTEFYRFSQQLPTDVINQILKWRDQEKQDRLAKIPEKIKIQSK